MKEINEKLSKATLSQKARLMQEQAQNKQVCMQIERQIKETKSKLRKLEKQYTMKSV